MTLDDYLETRVCNTIRFENGREFEVSARPRKGVGFTDGSMISFRPATEGRLGPGIRLAVLRQVASHDEGHLIMGTSVLLTQKDAEAVVAWLDGLNETKEGEGGQ